MRCIGRAAQGVSWDWRAGRWEAAGDFQLAFAFAHFCLHSESSQLSRSKMLTWGQGRGNRWGEPDSVLLDPQGEESGDRKQDERMFALTEVQVAGAGDTGDLEEAAEKDGVWWSRVLHRRRQERHQVTPRTTAIFIKTQEFESLSWANCKPAPRDPGLLWPRSPIFTAAAVDFKAMYGYQHLFLRKNLGIAEIILCLTLRRLLIPVPVAFVHLRARERKKAHFQTIFFCQ